MTSNLGQPVGETRGLGGRCSNRHHAEAALLVASRATSHSASSANTVIGTQSAVRAPGLTTRDQDASLIKDARHDMPGVQDGRNADHHTSTGLARFCPDLSQPVIPDHRHNRLTLGPFLG